MTEISEVFLHSPWAVFFHRSTLSQVTRHVLRLLFRCLFYFIFRCLPTNISRLAAVPASILIVELICCLPVMSAAWHKKISGWRGMQRCCCREFMINFAAFILHISWQPAHTHTCHLSMCLCMFAPEVINYTLITCYCWILLISYHRFIITSTILKIHPRFLGICHPLYKLTIYIQYIIVHFNLLDSDFRSKWIQHLWLLESALVHWWVWLSARWERRPICFFFFFFYV